MFRVQVSRQVGGTSSGPAETLGEIGEALHDLEAEALEHVGGRGFTVRWERELGMPASPSSWLVRVYRGPRFVAWAARLDAFKMDGYDAKPLSRAQAAQVESDSLLMFATAS